MGKVMDQEKFTRAFFVVFEETFERHHGVFLDKGTSLLETLENVSAAQASRPVGAKGATLAAHVAHITFYLDVLEGHLLGSESRQVDWRTVWNTVGEVSVAEWTQERTRLRATYERVSQTLRGLETWDDETPVWVALGIMAHTACHLGSIRQALHVLG